MLCSMTTTSSSQLLDGPAAAPPTVLDQPALDLVAKFFRALGDPTRLDLLRFLGQKGEATGSECVARAGLSQSRVSAHLACLVSCGLVSVRRQGRYAYYHVSADKVMELVELGTQMTAEHAASIASCLRTGPSD